jgi:AraC-like DNA-binding protein
MPGTERCGRKLARHRTLLPFATQNRIVIEHFDTRGSPISAGENLAVAGLILGILRWRGARDAVFRFDGASTLDDRRATVEQTKRWTITWKTFEPLAFAPLEQDEDLVPAVDFSGRAVSDPLVARLFAEQLGAPHARRAAADVASAEGLSLRTLQRRLAGAGWSLGDIVASARVHSATRLLATTGTPLALVGLLAGYSDQPHFQRAFRAAVGPTPAEYRKLARGA